MIDKLKLAAGVALVMAGIWAYYWLGEGTALVLRILAVVAGVAAGAGVAWFSEPGRQVGVVAAGSGAEGEKGGWASPKETGQTNAAGFALGVGMAGFFWGGRKTRRVSL